MSYLSFLFVCRAELFWKIEKSISPFDRASKLKSITTEKALLSLWLFSNECLILVV